LCSLASKSRIYAEEELAQAFLEILALEERRPGDYYSGMINFFVPYAGKKPASLEINGHRVIILSHDPALLKEGLGLMGADRLQRVRSGDSEEEQERILDRLARKVDGGVVVAPSDINLAEVIRNLKSELPWMH
jgi:hypothetical protein